MLGRSDGYTIPVEEMRNAKHFDKNGVKPEVDFGFEQTALIGSWQVVD